MDKTTWDSRLAREVAEPVVPLGQMRLLLTLDSESGKENMYLRVASAASQQGGLMLQSIKQERLSDLSLKSLNANEGENESDDALCKLYGNMGAGWSVGRQSDWLAGMAFGTPGLNGRVGALLGPGRGGCGLGAVCKLRASVQQASAKG